MYLVPLLGYFYGEFLFFFLYLFLGKSFKVLIEVLKPSLDKVYNFLCEEGDEDVEEFQGPWAHPTGFSYVRPVTSGTTFGQITNHPPRQVLPTEIDTLRFYLMAVGFLSPQSQQVLSGMGLAWLLLLLVRVVLLRVLLSYIMAFYTFRL